MEQPKHIKVRKIIWGIYVGIISVLILTGIIVLFTNEMGAIFIMVAFMLGVPLLPLTPWAFETELERMKMKRELYMKHQNQQLEEEFYTIDADVHHNSIKKRSRSAKEGFFGVEKCPNCGDVVESKEYFCNKCGTQIYIKCKKCKTVNTSADSFCKKCGNKLK